MGPAEIIFGLLLFGSGFMCGMQESNRRWYLRFRQNPSKTVDILKRHAIDTIPD